MLVGTLARVAGPPEAAELERIEGRFREALAAQRAAARSFLAATDGLDAPAARERLRAAAGSVKELREGAKALVARALPDAETKDADYVFISFILTTVPRGLVGLLIAVIFCAAMSSTASELSALASTATIDLHRRLRGTRPGADAVRDLRVSRAYTVMWGVLAVGFATSSSASPPRRYSWARSWGRQRSSSSISSPTLGFLWFNVIGCGIVIGVSLVAELARAAVRG